MLSPAVVVSKSAASSWTCVRLAFCAWKARSLSLCCFALTSFSFSDSTSEAGFEDTGVFEDLGVEKGRGARETSARF